MNLFRFRHMLSAAAILAFAIAGRAQVVRLHAEVTVEPHQDVCLGDLATISGVDKKTAEDLANTLILAGVTASHAVKGESILMALIAQRGPSAANGLQLSGAATCMITVDDGQGPALLPNRPSDSAENRIAAAMPAAPAITAITAASPQPIARQDKPAPAPAGSAPALKQLIEEYVQQELNLPSQDVRVKFDSISPLLDQPAASGQKWLFRSPSKVMLGTVNFEAQLVEGSKVLARLQIPATVEKQIRVVRLDGTLSRGEQVKPSMVKNDTAWIDRNLQTFFSDAKDAVGLEAQRDYANGMFLDQRDFKPVVLAAKGDALNVYYISGSLKVQVRGRALDGGKLHDVIQVKNEATNEIYQAVLIGNRLAVVGGTLDQAQEDALREAK